MRIVFAAALMAGVAVSTAALAQTAPVGQIGVNYSRQNLETLGVDADADVYQAEGSVQFGSGTFGGQVDGSVTRYESDDLGGDATSVSATGHLKYKADAYSAGAFLGAHDSEGVTLWGLGVEGKVVGDMGSIFVQGGYGQVQDLDNVDFWAVRAEGRYFVNDNFYVGANGGYTVATAAGPNLDMWNLGVDAEYQFVNAPVSVFAGYERGELKDFDLSSDTFRVGARFTFGGGLRARDQAGVGQGSVNSLFGGSLGSGVLAVAGTVLP
jgi:hypothetical protein